MLIGIPTERLYTESGQESLERKGVIDHNEDLRNTDVFTASITHGMGTCATGLLSHEVPRHVMDAGGDFKCLYQCSWYGFKDTYSGSLIPAHNCRSGTTCTVQSELVLHSNTVWTDIRS